MAQPAPITPFAFGHLDQAIAELQANKNAWARTSAEERIAILTDIKEALMGVSERWALTAARMKQIPEGSPLTNGCPGPML